MNTKEKRNSSSKSNNKKTKANIQKNYIIHDKIKWCKYSNKNDQIDGSNWETRLNKYIFIAKANLSKREHQIWSFGM